MATFKQCALYLFSQFFTLIAEEYAIGGSAREMNRWAGEIYATFLASHAVSCVSVCYRIEFINRSYCTTDDIDLLLFIICIYAVTL